MLFRSYSLPNGALVQSHITLGNLFFTETYGNFHGHWESQSIIKSIYNLLSQQETKKKKKREFAELFVFSLQSRLEKKGEVQCLDPLEEK